MTVPAGSAAPTSAISGKRSVTSSSPRDHRKTSPRRRISCERMPSHFHSACHSATSPSASGSPSSGAARKNGIRPAVVVRSPRRRRATSRSPGVGCQSPMSRPATVGTSRPATSARARVSSCCDTPTRKPPVMSLFQTKRCAAVEAGPGGEHLAPHRLLVHVAQRGEVFRHPDVSGRSIEGRRGGQQQRDRLGEVADGVVALLEQPVARIPAASTAQAASLRDGHHLAQLPAAEEEDGPGRVGRVGGGEVARQRLHLDGRLGRLVERGVEVGERLHAAPPPVGPPSRRRRARPRIASRPAGRRCRARAGGGRGRRRSRA